MKIAAVVVAPTDMITTAQSWAERGLVADSLWISSSELERLNPDVPNAITTVSIGLDHEPLERTLALALAELGDLDQARVVWVGDAGDTSRSHLGDFATQLRGLLPADQTHWIDVVIPTRRTDEVITPLAGLWVQFRVHTSDRPAPGVADAGWDLDLAVALHVTLALAGLLGGVTANLPWAQLPAEQHHVVRVFSRLVDGGMDARLRAQAFINTVLPVTHAAEQHTSDYLQPDETHAARIVEAAAAWVLSLGDNALSYPGISPSEFDPSPRIRVWTHLLRFARFIATGLRTLLGITPVPNGEVHHWLEFVDLGYNLGTEVKLVPGTDGIPDFNALESTMTNMAQDEIARALDLEGQCPSTDVWTALAKVATLLIDGGSPQSAAWETDLLTLHKRPISVAPARIALGDSEPVDTTIDELRRATNPAVAYIALGEASRQRSAPFSPKIAGGFVTSSARELANAANEQDETALEEQLIALGTLEPVQRMSSLLETIEGRVIGALLRSRLDSERWQRFATRPPQPEMPTWKQASSLIRRIWLTIIATTVLLGLVWRGLHDRINSAAGATISLVGGIVLLVLIVVVATIFLLYWLFRVWASYLEQGRRRLELLRLWLRRSLAAMAAHASLANAERTTRYWAELLSSVPGDDPAHPVGRLGSEAQSAPMAFRIGHPIISDEQFETWLAECAAAPGWRLACLQEVIASSGPNIPDDALSWLADDAGLTGGRLHSISTSLDSLQQRWRGAKHSAVAVALMEKIALHVDRLHVVRHPALPPQMAKTEAFLEELTPANDDQDEWPDDESHSWTIDGTVGEYRGDTDVQRWQVSPALCTGRIRIQIDQLTVAGEASGENDSDHEAPEGIR